MPYIKEINPENIDQDQNFFQSTFWAKFKENRGYDTQAFDIEYNGKECPLIIIYRPLTADAVFGYVPYGPDICISQENQGLFLEQLSELVRHRLPEKCCFLRYDLPWKDPYFIENVRDTWNGPPEARIQELRMNFGCKNWNLRKSPTDMQPASTVMLDLKKPKDHIFGEMHPKTRYSIRKAGQQGVRLTIRGLDAIVDWHRLYLEMAERKAIVAEKLDYFHELFSLSNHHEPDLRLYLGFKKRELLAGSIVAFHTTTAYYLYSASSLPGREYMASYAILWQAIQDARQKGCEKFDLFGIPPTKDPDHPMHGLYRFKTRFGGDIRHFRGCWDYPFIEKKYAFLAYAAGGLNPFHQK
jgi:lipid II:glycine glycyltransferase (peptidoglycan interpeptide bridge formation enzyme)